MTNPMMQSVAAIVRRKANAGAGGPFDPGAYGTVIANWDASVAGSLYDATSGGSLVSADGAIARWEDQSGNGYHLTQSTSGFRPIRKTAIQNGLDIVRLDGTEDFMDAAGLSETQPITIVAVWKGSTADAFQFLLDGIGANRIAVVNYSVGTGGQLVLFAGSDVSSGTRITAYAVTACVVNGASSVVWKDGSSVGSGNPGSGSLATGIRVGASNSQSSFLDGDVGQIIIYDGALDSTALAGVSAGLKTKWGTP